MDCCNLDSEVAETLNFLRPPVLRGFRRTCRGGHSRSSTRINFRESPNLLRDYRTKASKTIQIPVGEGFLSVSKEISSSVIDRKTSEEKIPKKYSVLSYKNFQHSHKTVQYHNSEKNKPLIQVTVIPKHSDPRSNHKLWKRVDSKQPHITVSNQENSTKSNNVYLVVSGRKERVNEIKATGSAEVASRSYIKNERLPVDEVKNFKQLIDSLNMDKKKKKGKKQKDDGKSKKGTSKNNDEERSREGSFAERNLMFGGDESSAYCSYPCASKQASRDAKDLNNRRSRVRITGRIGLTENDQYVLRCAATVDDKPILTNVAQIPLPPDMFNKDYKMNKKELKAYEQDYKNNNSKERGMKDSNVQADFHIETSYDTARRSKTPRKEAQFDSSENYNTVTLSNIETLKIVSNKNAKIQFNSPDDISNMGHHNVGIDEYNRSQYPNCCSNPVVIISVYPKQELSEKVKKPASRESGLKSPPKMTAFSSIQKTRTSLSAKLKSEKETRSPSPRSTRSPLPSRSPSPSPNPSPTWKQAKVKNSIVQTDSKTGKAKKESTAQTPNNHNTPQRRESFKESNKNSPRKLGSQSKTVDKKSANPNTASKAKSHEINPDVQMTKKALVDTYTKKITEQMDRNTNRKHPIKNDVSNVTINIEGEHEFYDLMFHQGNQTTALRVRRSVKEQGSQIHERDSPSLENFLLSENYPDPTTRKRSFSQNFYEPTKDDLGLQLPILARLNARDSIEICHRRERSSSPLSVGISNQEEPIATRTSGHHKAPGSPEPPLKHFQGDDCSLLDPVQRDKEIQELLGVKRSRSKLTVAEVKSGIYKSELSSYWCGNDCLLKEIEGSIDSYYNLSTSSTFEEQMNQILTTSADCAEAQCQTCELISNPPKSGASSLDPCYSILLKNDKVIEPGVKQSRQKKKTSRNFLNELCRVKISNAQKSDGCSKNSEKSEVSGYNQKLGECSDKGQCSTFQQIILNRSINVYLEVKKFSKQKPIVLSRKQYDKVKKAIGSNLKKNQTSKARSCNSDRTERRYRKDISVCDDPACNEESLYGEELACDEEPDCYDKQACCDEPTCDDEPGLHMEPTCDNKSACKPCCVCPKNDNVQLCNQSLAWLRNYRKHPEELLRTCYYCGRPQSKMNNYCYFCGMYQSVDEAERIFYQTSKDLPSSTSVAVNPTSRSMEIRYTSFAFVEFSSNDVEVQTSVSVAPLPSVSNLEEGFEDLKRSDSILTIFKGGRRTSVTPNLGTSSFYSLSTSEYSEDVGTSLEETKTRKPLFRRLMSCLVVRSARMSPLKLARPIPKMLQQSSVDSYHISTSLGAIELGSSIYDTSASFYSNHTIQPISSKMRRGGFFSSIRGFLTNKKSSRHQKAA